MKPKIALLLVLIFAQLRTAAQPLRPNDTVAICGDSITEQRIYTVYIEDYLRMCQPQPVADVTQFGWSGETIKGLLGRVRADVVPFRPTVVTLLYGMNDGGYATTNPAVVAAFEKDTETTIQILQEAGARTILVGSPGAVDTERFKTWLFRKSTPAEYNQTLFDLGQAAKAAALRHGVAWVDVHSVMLAAMVKAKAKYGRDYPVAIDGVHPSFNGHLVMAYAFLKAMGCTGDIGTITYDARAKTAHASAGHRIIAVSDGAIEVESTRYPFCFLDDPTADQSSRAMLNCIPFNEDLNRFDLVVTHTPGAMKVTWGSASKVFTAEELAHGVNLAAAFLDNTFHEAFAKVDAAVKAKQAFETPAIKTMLNGLSDWRRYFPGDEPEFDRLQAAVIEKDREFNRSAGTALQPVHYWLTITEAPDSTGS